MQSIKAKQRALKSDVEVKLKLNQDLAEKLSQMEREKEKKNSELTDLRSNQKNLKSEVDKHFKSNQDL